MAFLSKIGNMLRQTSTSQINAQFSASRPGLFQVFRCMSNSPSSKVFVGGISFQTDDQGLKDAFSQYGEVVEARIIVDRETGRSRGFGFVTYTSTEDASSAIQALDGQVLHGRQVRVNYAAERPPRNYGGGGGMEVVAMVVAAMVVAVDMEVGVAIVVEVVIMEVAVDTTEMPAPLLEIMMVVLINLLQPILIVGVSMLPVVAVQLDMEVRIWDLLVVINSVVQKVASMRKEKHSTQTSQ